MQLYCSFAIALLIACLRTRFHLPVPVRDVAIVFVLSLAGLFVLCTSLCCVLLCAVVCALLCECALCTVCCVCACVCVVVGGVRVGGCGGEAWTPGLSLHPRPRPWLLAPGWVIS